MVEIIVLLHNPLLVLESKESLNKTLLDMPTKVILPVLIHR